VAVLRLYAAVSWLRNDCTILAELSDHNCPIAVFIASLNRLAYIPGWYVWGRTWQNAQRTNFVERRKGEVRRIPLPRRLMNKVGIRPRFIANSSPPASMDGRSNSARVAREKEVALLRSLRTRVLTVAVVTMMIMVAMAMPLLADSTKER
jgi:hypothetical protein